MLSCVIDMKLVYTLMCIKKLSTNVPLKFLRIVYNDNKKKE